MPQPNVQGLAQAGLQGLGMGAPGDLGGAATGGTSGGRSTSSATVTPAGAVRSRSANSSGSSTGHPSIERRMSPVRSPERCESPPVRTWVTLTPKPRRRSAGVRSLVARSVSPSTASVVGFRSRIASTVPSDTTSTPASARCCAWYDASCSDDARDSAAAVEDETWQYYHDDFGNPYWYNTETGESEWGRA